MPNRIAMNLLPAPRLLKLSRGMFTLPNEVGVQALACFGDTLKRELQRAAIKVVRTNSAPDHPEGYALAISKNGIEISFRETGGLRAASATLRQLLRQYGRRLPCLKIRDWPDFARRGVMLDISRGRVPKLETLLDLAEKLADFKINELQLYTEHTFAYRKYKSVWQSWGALTGEEIRILDARCRELGIDLVPNQNSFGHLRYFLEDPKLKKLAEVVRALRSGDDAGTGIDFSAVRPRWRRIIPAPCPFCAAFTTNCCRIFPASSSTSAATRRGIWAEAKARNFASDEAKAAFISIF